jgi:lysophospholipase L1-like esterase
MRVIRSLLLAMLFLASPAWARVKVLCTIGDSLTQGGPILNGNPGWPSILASGRTGQKFGVLNGGVGGYTAAQAKALFESDFKGHGCTHLTILACTNDLASGTSAATCQSTLEALAASAREDTSGDPNGINVTVLTVPPRGGSASWDGTKETQRLALRTSILAMAADAIVDLEAMAGTGDPVEMAAAYRAADMLHFNGTPTTGGTPKVAALINAAVSW